MSGKTRSSLSVQQDKCADCGDNPTKFMCENCPGELCETCKCKHMKKTISRHHKIVPLTSNSKKILDLQHCSDHTSKKLERYCERCRKPVCIIRLYHTVS